MHQGFYRWEFESCQLLLKANDINDLTRFLQVGNYHQLPSITIYEHPKWEAYGRRNSPETIRGFRLPFRP